MPSAYTIALVDVDDDDRHQRYQERALTCVERHGGTPLVTDDSPEVLEGSAFGPRTEIVAWPSRDAARACLADADHQNARRLLDGAASVAVQIVAALPDPVVLGSPSYGDAPGYTLSLMDVHDREGYKAYTRLAGPVMVRHGCELLVDDRAPEVLGGDVFGSRTVLLKWASKDAALGWYRDPEYVEATTRRQAAANADLATLTGRAGSSGA